MKKIILIVIFTFVLSCKSPMVIGEINKFYVYDYFENRGFTTARAYTHFNDMNVSNINKIEINQDDCNKINLILKNIKPRNHFQTKFGRLMFIEGQTGDKLTKIVIASDNLIVDLSNNSNYILNSTNDKEWLSYFVNKYKNKTQK